MKKKRNAKKVLTLAIAILLVLPIFNVRAAETSSKSINDTYDTYFTDRYDQLTDENHVFQSVTYHELDFLLKSKGTYVVLFGGAWDEDTQAAIGYINEVAKASGVTAVHNFDTKLDGKTADIADSANSPFSRRYVELVNTYLTNIDDHVLGSEVVSYVDEVTSGRAPNQVTRTFEGQAKKIETPFLFVYNKDYKDGSDSTPIISSLESIDLANVDAYKAQVKAVFDAIPGKVDSVQNNDYITSSYNEFAGTTIFDESDLDIVIDPVTYDEMLQILESEGNYVFMYGCSWCPNTRAIAKLVNQYAKKYNVDKVYNWDTKLDGGLGGTPGVEAGTDSSNFLQTRTTGHPYANVYVDLVDTYFPNIETLYEKESNNVSYTDEAGEEIVVNKLQVPYVFTYNKDHKDADGNSAPILGHVELMYTWTNIQPDYESNGKIGVNYNNYSAALDDLFSSLAGLKNQDAPKGLTGNVPASPTSNDGSIAGTSTELEYKRAEDTQYKAVTGTSLSDLALGTYYIRYAAKDGYASSPAVIIDLNLEQQAPTATELAGIAPTTSNNDDGQLTGTTAALELKPTTAERYAAAKEGVTEGLPSGTYNVRYAAQYGYNASPAIDVVIPQFVPVFADVPETAWYYDAISYLANNQIASGTAADQFSPETKITRGQVIVLLLNAYGIELDADGSDNFTDAGNTYYTRHLAAAKRLGIASGVGDNKFAPEQNITRQDVFTLLHNALDKLGKLPAATTDVTVDDFSDSGQIADYARDAFNVFVESGIIVGFDAKLNPTADITRAEVSQIVYNLLSN